MSKDQIERLKMLESAGWKIIQPADKPLPGSPAIVQAPDGKRFIVDGRGQVLSEPESKDSIPQPELK